MGTEVWLECERSRFRIETGVEQQPNIEASPRFGVERKLFALAAEFGLVQTGPGMTNRNEAYRFEFVALNVKLEMLTALPHVDLRASLIERRRRALKKALDRP